MLVGDKAKRPHKAGVALSPTFLRQAKIMVEILSGGPWDLDFIFALHGLSWRTYGAILQYQTVRS